MEYFPPSNLQILGQVLKERQGTLLSPVFETKSHPGNAGLGVLKFAAWGRRAPLPVYALGGIDAGNARRLSHSGAAGIAGIGGWQQP